MLCSFAAFSCSLLPIVLVLWLVFTLMDEFLFSYSLVIFKVLGYLFNYGLWGILTVQICKCAELG